MDLTTLGVLLALGIGLIGIDAAVNSDTYQVHINVPKEIEGKGINRQIAEDVFTAEVARISHTQSLLAPPAIRATSERTVVGAVAKSLDLDEVAYTLQRRLGINPARLLGTLMPVGDQTRFYMTASSTTTGSFLIDISTDTGDNIELLRRGALLAFERISPYRAALHHFTLATNHPGDFSKEEASEFLKAEAIALRSLGEPVRPNTGRQRALFHNLLGLIALMRNQPDKAEKQFREVVMRLPDHAIGYLNLAFVHVHNDDYAAAIEYARKVLEPKPLTDIPQLLTAARITWAVAAWAGGRYREAEDLFEQATDDYWGTSIAYEYWAQMLQEMGRQEDAEVKMQLAAANEPFFENYAELAMLYLHLSPKYWIPLTRR